MIVTCEQCKTRFKIPDEKVAPQKGVKVRCTKCGHTFRVHREPSNAQTEQAPQHVPSRDHGKPAIDPFARFGAATEVTSEEATRPGVYALGVELTRPSTAESPSFELTAPARRTEPRAPAPFDFSAIAPAPVPAPAGEVPGAAPGAFDFSALTMPPPPRPASPPTPLDSTPSFDFSSLGSPSKQRAAAPAELDELELPPPPVALGAMPPATTAELGMLTVPSPQADSISPTLPAGPSPVGRGASTQVPPAATADAFFGAPLELETRKPLLDLPEDLSLEAAKGALFDLSAAQSPSPVAPAEVASYSPSDEVSARPQPSSPRRAEPVPAGEVPRRRTALGVIVNVVIAAGLVAGLLLVGSALLNEGKLSRETLSLEGLGGLFAPSSGFPATDISNGLYETKAGRPIFFVRGQITNRGAQHTRVLVQADLVEGAAVVRSERGLAGAVPSPEELHDLALSEGEDLTALAVRLAPRAVELAPGASAEFLVAFAEYPPDLEAFRVRVAAAALAGGAAALRP